MIAEPMTAAAHTTDSRYAAARLAVSVVLMTLGASGLFIVPVVLPDVQAEFGIARAEASTPYAVLMIGYGAGGLLMGRLADRFGVMVPVLIGGLCLGSGLIAAGHAGSLTQFALAQGLLIGMLGTSATFAPLVADTSLWFTRRRGIAVAICASGNYLGGAVWPPVLQYFFDTSGWRSAYTGVGVFCILCMIPLAFALRRRPPALDLGAGKTLERKTIDIPPNALLALLCVAGVACCVAM